MTPTEPGASARQRGEGKTGSSGARSRRETGARATGTSETTSSPSKSSDSGSSRSAPSGAGTAGAGSPAGRAGRGGPHRRAQPDDRVRVMVAAASQAWAFGVLSCDLDTIAQALESDPDIDIVHRIDARPRAGTVAAGQAILVAEMPAARAADLGRNLQLLVEIDSALEAAAMPTMDPALVAAVTLADPGAGGRPPLFAPFYGAPLVLTVEVTDPGGHAVEDAVIYAVGRRGTAFGVTDRKGHAELTVFEESAEAILSLAVAPARGHWGRWIPEPRLDPATANPVVVERLDAAFPGFPAQELVGWGLRAMRIDQLPPAMQGEGTMIACIDSGAATAHPDLGGPSAGFDLLAGNATGWKDDPLAHGTHSVGVVAAGRNGAGVRGIAPEADIVVLKLLPGGRCSTLIEAIDRCIDAQVDVINLGLCATRPSALVEQRLRHARQAGIACIAAAGNTGGPVAYPASSPAVLAVAAVGRVGEFPPDSLHAAQPAPGLPLSPDGFFAARLSAHGWEVDVCGPGVAVVSTVPPDGYAAWDGTSAAAAHVTGLAALLLAHHPDFAGPFRAPTAARVDRLFDILRRNARPLPLGDPGRTGAGLPDAVLAFRDVMTAPVPGGPGTPWWPAAAIDLTTPIDPTWPIDMTAPVERAAPVDVADPLDRLAAVLHQAGIVNGNGGNGESGQKSNGDGRRRARSGAAGDDTALALAQLRATLERAGLWSGS